MFTPMFFDVTWDASKKKTRKTVDLGLHWLDALLQKLSDEEKVPFIHYLLLLLLFITYYYYHHFINFFISFVKYISV